MLRHPDRARGGAVREKDLHAGSRGDAYRACCIVARPRPPPAPARRPRVDRQRHRRCAEGRPRSRPRRVGAAGHNAGRRDGQASSVAILPATARRGRDNLPRLLRNAQHAVRRGYNAASCLRAARGDAHSSWRLPPGSLRGGHRTPTAQSSSDTGWTGYGGGPDNSRYFPSKQITRPNVSRLQVAWTYPLGDTGSGPIVVRGVISGRGRNGSLIALDAATVMERSATRRASATFSRAFPARSSTTSSSSAPRLAKATCRRRAISARMCATIALFLSPLITGTLVATALLRKVVEGECRRPPMRSQVSYREARFWQNGNLSFATM
jgi:hypothetical protein